MTIRLPNDIEDRLIAEAERRGVTPDEYATKLLGEQLPPAPKPQPQQRNSLEELFAQWEAEDHTDDPEEIARRQQEFEEFKQAMNQNRLDMEGPNSRKPFP